MPPELRAIRVHLVIKGLRVIRVSKVILDQQLLKDHRVLHHKDLKDLKGRHQKVSKETLVTHHREHKFLRVQKD